MTNAVVFVSYNRLSALVNSNPAPLIHYPEII